MRRYRQLLLLGMGLFSSSCVSTLTSNSVDPTEKETEYHYVEDATAAWRNSAGDVTLCVIGLPAGESRGPSGLRRYSIVYPGSSPPEPLFSLHEAIPGHIGDASDVRDACSPSIQGMTSVPIYTVYEPEFHKAPYTGRPDRAMATFLENYAPAPAVYVFRFKVTSGAYSGEHLTLFYVRETVIWDDIRVVEILTVRR